MESNKGIFDMTSLLLNVVNTFMQRSPSYSQKKKEEFYEKLVILNLHKNSQNPDLIAIKILLQDLTAFVQVFENEIKEKDMIVIESKSLEII